MATLLPPMKTPNDPWSTAVPASLDFGFPAEAGITSANSRQAPAATEPLLLPKKLRALTEVPNCMPPPLLSFPSLYRWCPPANRPSSRTVCAAHRARETVLRRVAMDVRWTAARSAEIVRPLTPSRKTTDAASSSIKATFMVCAKAPPPKAMIRGEASVSAISSRNAACSARAEFRLSGFAKNLGDHTPFPDLDAIVQILKVPAQPLTQCPAYTGLPGPHEADQKDCTRLGPMGANQP